MTADLWIMSDLHLEAVRRGEPAFEPSTICAHDVVVVAGDVAWSPAAAVEWCDAVFAKPVVLVAGNHEFFGSHGRAGIDDRIAEGRRRAAETEGRVRFLEDETTVVAGVRFVGCTLWTDFGLHGRRTSGMLHALKGMPDYGQMPGTTPWHLSSRHAASLARIESELSKPFDGSTVVVTHHAPSGRSIAAEFEGSGTSPAFASDLEAVVLKHAPAMWIHGHVHSPSDYRIGGTRVLCNPKGYRDEAPGFRTDMVIEVG